MIAVSKSHEEHGFDGGDGPRTRTGTTPPTGTQGRRGFHFPHPARRSLRWSFNRFIVELSWLGLSAPIALATSARVKTRLGSASNTFITRLARLPGRFDAMGSGRAVTVGTDFPSIRVANSA